MSIWFGLIGAVIAGWIGVVLAPWFGIELEDAPVFWGACVVMGLIAGNMWGLAEGWGVGL